MGPGRKGGIAPVRLGVVGVSYQTAPVELREVLAVGPEALPEALLRLHSFPEVAEAAVLSTCNRTEVYLTAQHILPSPAAIFDALVADAKPRVAELNSYIYEHHSLRAARHLMRVTAGLESLVVGEAQILGQVRSAYQAADKAGTVGSVFRYLFPKALALGKQVRSEHSPGFRPTSVADAAVGFAAQQLGILVGRSVLVIGAGEMAELVARNLRAAGVGSIVICNRTAARARPLAAAVGGVAASLPELEKYLPQVDLVISATGAQSYILSRTVLAGITAPCRRPLMLLDIAVPRDIDPGAAALPGVSLFDIDDLAATAGPDPEPEGLQVRRVEALIEEAVAGLAARQRSYAVRPAVAVFRHQAEAIRRHQLGRALRKLPGLTEREQKVIAAMTVALVKKLLNPPTQRLLSLAEAGDLPEARAAAAALSYLFNLSPADSKVALQMDDLVGSADHQQGERDAQDHHRHSRQPVSPGAKPKGS